MFQQQQAQQALYVMAQQQRTPQQYQHFPQAPQQHVQPSAPMPMQAPMHGGMQVQNSMHGNMQPGMHGMQGGMPIAGMGGMASNMPGMGTLGGMGTM